MGDNQEALAMITDQAGRLLEDAVTPQRLKSLLQKPGSFDRDLWLQTVGLGWAGAAVPEEAGGFGLGWEVLCALAGHLGAVTASLPLIQNTVLVDALAQADCGYSAVIEQLVSGEAIATLALFDQGDNGISDTPQLVYGSSGLNGVTAVAPFAAVAGFALVHALREDQSQPALLLVALDQKGVKRDLRNCIDNARGAAALDFANATATPVAVGDGASSLLMRVAARAVIATAFEQVGGAGSCLQSACDYARERKVFGQPIGAFQGIKHKLADIYADIEIARGCALDALAALESNPRAALAYAAAARVTAITAYEHAARENIQVHGGIGVTWESAEHHYYRRSRSLALELGAAPYWRDVLVDHVELLAEGY